MLQKNLRILVVEDNAGDVRLVKEMLNEVEGLNYEFRHAVTCSEGIIEAGLFKPDVVLHDLSLPDVSGLDTVRTFINSHPKIPLIILTGLDDENTGLAAVKEGAQDYIVKGEVTGKSLLRIIQHSIERKTTSEMIKESEERYRVLFNSGNDSIFVHQFDENRRASKFIRVNDLACEKLGYTREELLNLSPADIDCGAFDEEKKNLREKLFKENKILFEASHRTKSGENLPVEINSRLFIYQEKLTCLSVARDIRERKIAEEKINRMNIELQEHINTKDKFFSIIAHDLRSPMHALMGLSQILKEDFDELPNDETKRLLESLYELSQNTFKLLDNLLDWSRFQRGKMKFAPKTLGLYSLLKEEINQAAQVALHKSITIETEIEEHLTVYADPNMMQLVMRNLISNAVKFSNPGGQININAAASNNSITISVKDDGIGMDEDILNNLFHLDKDVTRPGTNKERGTGLGLQLCYDMIKLHHGSIEVESQPEKGSTFSVILPLRETLIENLDNHYLAELT